jgi:protein-arginine kinase activator protein McsA
MPLCEKCHQKEATVHMSFLVNGKTERQEHFCSECAPPTGLEGMTLEQIKAQSIEGKKCEFCGNDAISGVRDTNDTIYWCRDCGMEKSRISLELLAAEHPDWKEQLAKHKASFVGPTPDVIKWGMETNRKAIQILRERKKQKGQS